MVIGTPLTDPRRVLVHRDIGFHRPLFIRVALTDTLATTDASTTDFTVLTKYAGLPAGIETISLINNPAASSNYLFEGVSGDVMLCFYDWSGGGYFIIQKEC